MRKKHRDALLAGFLRRRARIAEDWLSLYRDVKRAGFCVESQVDLYMAYLREVAITDQEIAELEEPQR